MRRALVTAEELDIGEELHHERLKLLAKLALHADSYSEDVADQAGQTLKECRSFLRKLKDRIQA